MKLKLPDNLEDQQINNMKKRNPVAASQYFDVLKNDKTLGI